ncbi:MAG: DUF1844 domain-containing protein [Firmicutes bacterium]|nr:DUF1844 domain-containing protein [Bacillota bacterium]
MGDEERATPAEDENDENREDAEGGQGRAVPLLALDTETLLEWFSGLLATRAWVDMGLLVDPLSGKTKKKPESARLAIDAYEALLRALRPRLGPGEARRMESLLTDLRLNFVRQAETPTGLGPAEGEPS